MSAKLYSRGDFELAGGSLVTIYDFSLSEKNGGKVENTFRASGAGFSFGAVEISGSFKRKISTDAPERDFKGYVRNKQLVDGTFKYPDGSTDPVTVIFTDRAEQQGLEGAMEETLTFVGFAAAPSPF